MEPVTAVKVYQVIQSETPFIAPAIVTVKTAAAKPAAEVKRGPSGTYVKVMSKEEISKKMQTKNGIQVVNVLDPEKYTLGFIKGSKRIPLDNLDARFNELDKSKPVVTYCASRGCNASMSAAENLVSKGFNASAYEGGIKEWKEAGLPTET